MLIKSFPAPKRVDYVPSPYEPDDDGVLDIGYSLGRLSDGRSYRLECWQMDDMLMLTLMFSSLGLSAYNRLDMQLLVEAEEILTFSAAKRPVQCTLTKDDAGSDVWMVNVLLADANARYGELKVMLQGYK